MANFLPADKVSDIMEMLWAGHSLRDVAKIVQCAKGTVNRYRKVLVYLLEQTKCKGKFTCQCGKDAGHKGFCPWRKKRKDNGGGFLTGELKKSPFSYPEWEAGLNWMARNNKNIGRRFKRGLPLYHHRNFAEPINEPVPESALLVGETDAGAYKIAFRDKRGRYLQDKTISRFAWMAKRKRKRRKNQKPSGRDILEGISKISASHIPAK